MARTSSFGFTNTTGSTHPLTPTELGLVGTNYTIQDDKDAKGKALNQIKCVNKTAPTDCEEVIVFKVQDIDSVTAKVEIENPAKSTKGVQYTVMSHCVLTTTDPDYDFRVDEPIVASIQIRHNKSGNITPEHVGTVLMRAVSACRRNDGSWRFDDLMRGADKPYSN